MILPVDVLEVDVLVVDVLELDVLGARPFLPLKLGEKLLIKDHFSVTYSFNGEGSSARKICSTPKS
jgi:hypothetical protein